MEDRRQSPYSRTSPGSARRRTTRSATSSGGCLGAMKPLKLKVGSGRIQAFYAPKPSEWVGGSLTQSSFGSLSAAGDSFSLPCRVSLSSVLEKEPVHRKYFLSPKACAGVLRRAELARKKLPEALVRALQAGAQGQSPSGKSAGPPEVIAFNSTGRGSQLPSPNQDTSIASTLTASQRGAVAFVHNNKE